jgi:hypothetical protein
MALKSLVRVEAPAMDELAAYQQAAGSGGRGEDHLVRGRGWVGWGLGVLGFGGRGFGGQWRPGPAAAAATAARPAALPGGAALHLLRAPDLGAPSPPTPPPQDHMAEIAAALPEAAARRATFVPGDKVVVVQGDLMNLEAVVTKVRGQTSVKRRSNRARARALRAPPACLLSGALDPPPRSVP